MPNLSRRGYARSRGLSESVVRRHLASGLLAEALTVDDLIDSERADQLLADTITKPKTAHRVPVVLRTAQQRRLKAQVRDLLDEVEGQRTALINPSDSSHIETALNGLIAQAYRRLIDIAPEVAGQPGPLAFRTLDGAAQDCLGWFQETWPAWSERNLDGVLSELPVAPTPPEPDLDTLSPIELAALRENLRAELLERQRLLGKGVLVDVEETADPHEERLSISKSLFKAIPGRLAQRMEHATVDEARAAIEREVEQAVGALQ